MSRYAIKAAIDALQRTDVAGFSNWSYYRREALIKMHQAYDDYEHHLALARTTGFVKATAYFTVINVVCVGLYAWRMGWI